MPELAPTADYIRSLANGFFTKRLAYLKENGNPRSLHKWNEGNVWFVEESNNFVFVWGGHDDLMARGICAEADFPKGLKRISWCTDDTRGGFETGKARLRTQRRASWYIKRGARRIYRCDLRFRPWGSSDGSAENLAEHRSSTWALNSGATVGRDEAFKRFLSCLPPHKRIRVPLAEVQKLYRWARPLPGEPGA